MSLGRNVLGEELVGCSTDPMTGAMRDGCCRHVPGDVGLHILCAEVTEEFLEYSNSVGNDLSTPAPEYQFDGLKPGDRWCLCVSRWVEAMEAGVAPPVILEATSVSALEFVDLDDLKKHAIED
ncbi:TPA: DUF2237 domain-containing protein [Candidatus Latescibacteria bacterium]|nr:hypothetical protein [Gemmatimonadota bacterium]HAA73631.1 DUF2237 domain-containing protein [Candidatus Latescibacterota bacterium]